MSTYCTSTARNILGAYIEAARDTLMSPDRLRESGCVTWQECTCSIERSKDNLAESHAAVGVEPGPGPWFGGGWHWGCWRGLLGATSHRRGHLWSLSNMTPETSGASRWLCCCKWWCLDSGWSNEKFSWYQPQTFLKNLGPVLCHVQGNGAVTGWVRKPFYPGVRPSQLMLVVLLRTKIMAFMGKLSGNLEWKQWRELQSYHSFKSNRQNQMDCFKEASKHFRSAFWAHHH